MVARVTVNTKQFNREFDNSTDRLDSRLNKALTESVNEGLEIIEEVQIKSYRAKSNPSQPSGSKYKRTFRLQRSSKTRKVRGIGSTGPQGQWIQDSSIARYGSFVLGTANMQAAIHRGRWKSAEQVVDITADKLEKVAIKEVSKAVKGV